MKKLYSLFFVGMLFCTMSTYASKVIVNDFDNNRNHALSAPGALQIVKNPSGNDSVAKYTDGTGAWDNIMIDYGVAIDISVNHHLQIMVKASVPGILKAKIQGGTSAGKELDDSITYAQSIANAWVTYTYDFSAQADGNYKQLVFFFNAGVATGGTDIYYINNIMWSGFMINDFDASRNVALSAPGALEIVKNPIGTDSVCKYTDGTGAWDNIMIDYGYPIDLSVNNILTLKVKTTVPGILKAKIQGGTSAGKELDDSITVAEAAANTWTTHTWDFSSQADGNYKQLVLFFNAGVATGGADIYYINDIQGLGRTYFMISDFDAVNPKRLYFDPGSDDVLQVVANPSGTGMVGKYIDGSDAWACIKVDYMENINLTENNILSMKVKTTKAGILKAKLQDGKSAGFELDDSITKADAAANAWKTYTWDFSSQATALHHKLILFFDAGVANSGGTYYIDDIKGIGERLGPDTIVPVLSAILTNDTLLTITLAKATFASTLTAANWTITGLPTGVTMGALTRTNGTKATIVLKYGAVTTMTSTANITAKVGEAINHFGYTYDADLTATVDLSTTGINNNSISNLFSIYPIPATNIINVKSGVNMDNVSIISITGAVIKSVGVNSNSAEINVSDLNPGLYFVSIKSAKGTQISKITVK